MCHIVLPQLVFTATYNSILYRRDTATEGFRHLKHHITKNTDSVADKLVSNVLLINKCITNGQCEFSKKCRVLC